MSTGEVCLQPEPFFRRFGLRAFRKPVAMIRPFDPAEASLADIDDQIAEDSALLMSAHWAGHSGEAEHYAFELDTLRALRTVRLDAALRERDTA